MLKSKRGIELVYQPEGFKREEPMLTVENYCKWYEMFLVMPDDSVQAVELYDHVEFALAHPSTTTWGDHMPNPKWVLWLCNKFGWTVCNRSLEIITGRWVIEHENRYSELFR